MWLGNLCRQFGPDVFEVVVGGDVGGTLHEVEPAPGDGDVEALTAELGSGMAPVVEGIGVGEGSDGVAAEGLEEVCFQVLLAASGHPHMLRPEEGAVDGGLLAFGEEEEGGSRLR